MNRKYYQLPPKALWQMRVRALLSSVVMMVLFIACAWTINVMMATPLSWGLLLLILLVVWLVISLLYFVLTKLEYDFTAFHLGYDGLIIRKGMLWRSETFVLRSRVQHIDVAQAPMDRLFGLATIKVYTAGTKLGCISLSGLNKETAESIRNQLITHSTDTL